MTLAALPTPALSPAHRALIATRVAAVVADSRTDADVRWLSTLAAKQIAAELANPHHADRPVWLRGRVDYPDKFVLVRAQQIAEDKLGIAGTGRLNPIRVTYPPYPDAA